MEEIAENHLGDPEDRENFETLKNKVYTLIRCQVTKASTSGFLTGLGGGSNPSGGNTSQPF